MAKNKTTQTEANVLEFIDTVSDTEQKKNDSLALLELMKEISGYDPKMWGPSIIGFGKYHYKYASGHEGDAPLCGFSPRKSAISLYVFTGLERHEYMLEGLGKYTMGKACIYVKKISDIDLDVMERIIRETTEFLKEKYEVEE